MPLFFAITLFVSAVLLFLIEPLFAKMVLPLLGGTPAVWNTCMVFFQAALLAGYAYAHAATARIPIRRQALLHLGVLALPVLTLPLLTLPIRLAQHEELGTTGQPMLWLLEQVGLLSVLEQLPSASNPIPWLLLLLLVAVGLPFFALSTSAPLLQKWFVHTGHPAAHDPYFLYAASNLGSMLALLGYPFLLEPSFSLIRQSQLWIGGYVLWMVLISSGALLCLRGEGRGTRGDGRGVRGQKPVLSTQYSVLGTRTPHPSPLAPRPWLRRLRWVALAFVPSSLMLSVTTYLTTDIAAIPLLWVIPLALYLLTFILVFARNPMVPHAGLVRVMPLVILLLAIVMLSEATEPVWLVLLLHLLALLVIALVCHGELAQDRPAAEHLTEFYLWLSVGGVLGGLLNALVAPLLFNGIVEYPLVLVLACLLRRPQPEDKETRRQGDKETRKNPASPLLVYPWLDVALPVALGLITVGLIVGGQAAGLEPGGISVGLMFGLPAVVCYTFLHRPIRFGLGIGALLLASVFYHGVHGRILHRERSFFGVHRVTLDPEGGFRELVHGNTVHGRQSVDPTRHREPLTYYHRTGPIGQVFTAFSGTAAKSRIAVVGLGTGSLAAYGEAGQHFTYYEIDPTVDRLAHDTRYFTFLHDSPARVEVILGDARLTLAEAPARQYGMLIIDAFSSDAIPLHLLTRQALQLYLDKLADDGILAFNISNRYLQLQPVLGDLARALGLVCLGQADMNLSEAEKQAGKSPSQWLVLARARTHLGKLANDPRWQTVPGRPHMPVWTDDFSNLFSVFQWE